MFSYLQNRHGNYSVRVRVPRDLSSVIPQAEIIKSLKTRDMKTARASALPYLQTISQTFSLVRSHFITPVQAQERLGSLLGTRGYKTKVIQPQVTTEAPTVVPSIRQETNVVAPAVTGVNLSTISAQFIKDRQHEWTHKTRIETEGVFRLIIDIMGDVPVQSIDRLKARELRDSLSLLPPNLYKCHPKHTARQVLDMVNSGELTVTPMSITSVNKNASRLNTLMLYAMREGHIKENPANGLSIKQKRSPDTERKAYDREDIKRVNDSLPHDSDTPEKTWIPLIGMYSGLRLNEVCQLYVDDIKEIDGVCCFDVNDDKNKTLKTESSRRIVPVHPALVSMGFLAYVKDLKSRGEERLWGNLNWREADGYSNAYGKCYQRYNRHYVTKDPLKCFHSFRHTFADSLKQLGVQESAISELLGHVNDNISTGRYGKKYRPEVLLEAVKKIDYGIDRQTIKVSSV